MNINEKEQQQILDLLEDTPILKEKMIVDLVNGIEVSKDHLVVRSKRSNIFSRLWDDVSGTSSDRQQRIDQQFQKSLETICTWLQRLQIEQIGTYKATTIISNKLLETREAIRQLANSHFELRSKMDLFINEIKEFERSACSKFNSLTDEIENLGLRQSAMIHLDDVFYAWEAGVKYQAFSPLIQLLLVLEELYWSPFGAYDKVNPEFRNQLRDRCIVQLKKLTGLNGQTIVPTVKWVEEIHSAPKLHKEMVYYLVDSTRNKMNFTLSFMTASLGNQSDRQKQAFPIVLSTWRLSERLIQERGNN